MPLNLDLFFTPIQGYTFFLFIFLMLFSAIPAIRLQWRLLVLSFVALIFVTTIAWFDALYAFNSVNIIVLFFLSLFCMWIQQRFAVYSITALIINIYIIFIAVIGISFAHAYKIEYFLIFSAWVLLLISQCGMILLFRKSLSFFFALITLKAFSHEIIINLLRRNRAAYPYFIEQSLRFKKNRCMRALYRLYEEEQYKRKWAASFVFLQKLFDLLLDCAQIHRRIDKEAMLDICRQELLEIDRALNKVWWAMLKKNEIAFQQSLMVFDQAIQKLDRLNQHVLQTSVHDPLAFLLFIGNLKSLHAEMQTGEHLSAVFFK